MTKDEALDKALEAWQTSVYGSESHHKAMLLAMTNMAQARALDKKADNARELGLDYEPVAWMYWQSCLNDDGTQTAPWVQRYSKFKPPESVINKEITPLYTTPPAQPAPVQEPYCYHDGRNIVDKQFASHSDVFPLYTTPPAQRQWVGLTDEEAEELRIQKEFDKWGITEGAFKYAVRDIEAKLRSKNNG